ncbi:hypothetical protein Trydic_g22586 [Trypoxylus dichotomus]
MCLLLSNLSFLEIRFKEWELLNQSQLKLCCFLQLVKMFFRCCCCRRRKTYKTTPVYLNPVVTPSSTRTVKVPNSQLNGRTTNQHHFDWTTALASQSNGNTISSHTKSTSTVYINEARESFKQQVAQAEIKQNQNTINSVTNEVNNTFAPGVTSDAFSDIKDQQPIDMIKISIELDNSDIGQVPPVRPSIGHSNNKSLKQHEIKEEKELTSDSSSSSDSEIDQANLEDGSSTVTFAPRREGIRETVNVDAKKEIPNYQKSTEDITHIKNAIAANDFFANVLTEESLNKVIGAMKERKVEKGTVIIEEGEPGNNVYISSRGTYEVYIKKKLYSTFSDKRVFGELAILYNSNRAATIRTVTDGKVWMLQRSVYQQIMVQSAIQDFEQTLSFLRNVPLVNNLNDESLTKIANILKKEFFKTSTIIIQEGHPGDKFYIIRAGCVTVTKTNEGKVSELGKGAFFGERALLKDDVRQATVLANAPGVECLTLTREEFKKHFNDNILLPDSQQRHSLRKPKRDQEEKEKPRPTNEYSDIILSELEKKATLGVGGFGRVELVQHKHNSKLTFALKYLKKIDMVQQDQVTHVFNERDIQIACDSVFIARLYKTFQDNKYLYFLMESCLGGDLWTYLQKRKGRMVPETHARFYAGCVLEAFAYLHERNYIYRDLKPENLLIDIKGYIKLTDFGFAKSLKDITKTYTFAGTPEYVAPEIIYNKGHDKSVDYWAFGILIFELLVGKTPFRTDDHTNMMTYNRILRGINSISFPSHVTNSAKHLIQKLCRPVPTDRLGCQKNGIQDIRNHNFFHGFEWEKLRIQTIKPPFVPKLSSNIDTKHFEKFNDDYDTPPDDTTSFADF